MTRQKGQPIFGNAGKQPSLFDAPIPTLTAEAPPGTVTDRRET
jgi:hypothetical protein